MSRMLAGLVAAVLISASPATGQMQDFTNMDINAMNNAFNDQMNGQLNQLTSDMIQHNLADPYVQQVIASGACGSGSPEQLAYIYSATGGCTPQGFDQFNQDTQDISGRERAFSDSLYPN